MVQLNSLFKAKIWFLNPFLDHFKHLSTIFNNFKPFCTAILNLRSQNVYIFPAIKRVHYNIEDTRIKRQKEELFRCLINRNNCNFLRFTVLWSSKVEMQVLECVHSGKFLEDCLHLAVSNFAIYCCMFGRFLAYFGPTFGLLLAYLWPIFGLLLGYF